MIQITDTISYDDTKPLQEQSAEFLSWVNENVLTKINDQYQVTDFDAYHRPASYVFTTDGKTATVYPLYLTEDAHNWSISGYNLIIT